jgi:hypothetical protein
VTPKHLHACRYCYSPFWCRGVHCAGRRVETCEDCQPQAPPPEREYMRDQDGNLSGLRRVPAPGAE